MMRFCIYLEKERERLLFSECYNTVLRMCGLKRLVVSLLKVAGEI